MNSCPRPLLRKALACSLVAWMTFPLLGTARAASTDLSDVPIFVSKNAPPNLMLDLSVEWPTGVVAAYNDNYVDPASPGNAGYGCSGRASDASAASNVGVCYFEDRTYLGYFDPLKCYDYDGNPGTESSPPSPGGYFKPAEYGTGTYGHRCSGKWSGNFLNWATMQAIDTFRWSLTGGDRWVDTPTKTIIEKARHSGQGRYNQFPIKRLSTSSFTAGSPSVTVPGVNPSTVANLPVASSTLYARVHDNSVTDTTVGPFFINFYNNTWDGPQLQVDCTLSVGNWSGACLRTYYVRVEVCDPQKGLEPNCRRYGTSWKPTGLMQQNADRMRFGVFGYLLDNDRARAGGVMRARLKDVGPTMIGSLNPPVANPRAEFSAADGVYTANPDNADASASGVSQSGVFNYLNKFGKASAGYKRTDTISELYYESLRYLNNMGSATPEYVAGVTQEMKDGFPVITTWDDPIQYSCQKNYTVMIADVNAWCDYALPGTSLTSHSNCKSSGPIHSAAISNAIPGLNVTTEVNKVAALDNSAGWMTGGYGNLANVFAPDHQNRGNTWYLAGLAYWANTNDLRPDKTAGTSDRITMQTYMVDVAETGSWFVNDAANNPINQMSLAAKYGGFEDVNLDGVPANQQTWDENNDGVPDNYFLASRPDLLVKSLNDVFTSVLSKGTAAAAVAVSNANVTSSDRSSFSTSFNSGTWSGDLRAFQIDLVTGLPSDTPTWSAKAQVDALADAVNSRYIVTHKGTGATGPTGNGIRFRAGDLSSTQLGLLTTPFVTPSDAADVIAFLRGDRSKEGTAYRIRASRLPDFVNAEPVFVGPPVQSFADNGYAAFATSKAGRTKMVYQGGNGGMLHAFNAGTGKEEWAYVPNLVMGNLNNLSSRQGFVHRFYVDGTPLAADVDFSNTASGSGGPDWRTILVGGLGKGGRGYYALDITDPIPSGESAAAQKVLWEFPNSSISASDALNVGFTYGRPVIVKTKARGWVVIVTSGYNNGTDSGGSGGDGEGHIYVLDARNGALIKDIPTGVGTAADPSGLAKMSAFVDASDVDNTIKYLYGGDLKGNLWRVDFTGNNPNQWSIAKLATFVDASGNIQPVTTEPELAEVDEKPLVMVGTGQLFGESDIPGAAFPNAHATQTQTMYGILDDLSANPVVNPLRSQLVQQIFTIDAATQNRTLTSNGVDYTTQRGWYVDLPGTGERSNTDPALALGVLVFTTNVPDPDPCSPGGKSFFYTIDYKTGGKVSFSGASPFSGLFAGNALASRPTIIKLPNGTVRAIIRLSDSTNIAPGVPVPPSSTSGKRVNWKEVLTK